ncbi:hypothetical protein [Vibrio sagamiensis]|nr:hypothetical protein [Vibrio sagamiensis]PNQ64734.1 hypothetical protein C1141_09675 [Vibrio agarivorans]
MKPIIPIEQYTSATRSEAPSSRVQSATLSSLCRSLDKSDKEITYIGSRLVLTEPSRLRVSKITHTQQQMQAITKIVDAVKNQYKCSATEAKNMLKEVQSDPKKITASQLHTLHENIENKLKKEETKSKVDLAVYLTGKLTIGEEVDKELLDDLKKANDSVNKTRAQLFHGQGNVTTNLKKTQEPYWRLNFSRNYARHFGCHTETLAKKMGSGNCGEHASLTFTNHAATLKAGQQLHRVNGADGFDHAWAEVKLAGDQRIIMDAWATGPAVLSEDSAFSRRPKDRVVNKELTSRQANQYHKSMMDKYDKLHKSEHKIESLWDREKKYYEAQDIKIDKDYAWAPTPVLNEKFMKNVKSQLNSKNVLSKLNKEKAEAKKEGLRIHKVREIHVDRMINLGKEIKTVGALRSLKMDLKSSLEHKGSVIESLDKMTKR